ncbi:MAG: hypothetical protein WKG07_23295 [Hymenobacter sp.]
MDIGGGTSGRAVLRGDSGQRAGAAPPPVFSSSFRFAGNDLWGDGAADIRNSDNGLVLFGLGSSSIAAHWTRKESDCWLRQTGEPQPHQRVGGGG